MSVDDMAVQPGSRVRVMMDDGSTADGRVISTEHWGARLNSIGFFSPDLGHRNYIDDSILIKSTRILAII